MEDRVRRGTAEVVGIAAAAAAAVGGLIVALSRAQEGDEAKRQPKLDTATAAHFASTGVERGRDVTRATVEMLADAYPEIRETARHLLTRLSDNAGPTVERATTSLPSAAAVRTTGVSMLERLQETMQETVKPAAEGAIHTLRERIDDGRDGAIPPAGIIAATGASAQRAMDRSSQAAHTAVTSSKNAAKETMAAAAWTAIGGALLYFVLLSDEQRQKVKSAVSSAIEQIQLLVRDFQGYEDEF